MVSYDLARLKAALDANEAALGDRAGCIETEGPFHFVPAEITPPNPVFAALHGAMSARLRGQRVVTLDVPGREARAGAAHRGV